MTNENIDRGIHHIVPAKLRWGTSVTKGRYISDFQVSTSLIQWVREIIAYDYIIRAYRIQIYLGLLESWKGWPSRLLRLSGAGDCPGCNNSAKIFFWQLILDTLRQCRQCCHELITARVPTYSSARSSFSTTANVGDPTRAWCKPALFDTFPSNQQRSTKQTLCW